MRVIYHRDNRIFYYKVRLGKRFLLDKPEYINSDTIFDDLLKVINGTIL